jgi:hypothetical protein
MALPDYFKNAQGTAISWKSSGGDYALTLTSLTNGSYRQGAKGDLGATWAQQFAVLFTSSVGSAATNGLTINLFWATSTNGTAGTDNPGNTDGTDSSLSNGSEVSQQLIFIGSLNLSNARGTNVQKQYFTFFPPTRYGMPVVGNLSGQTLGGTAADHEVRLTPIESLVQDTV